MVSPTPPTNPSLLCLARWGRQLQTVGGRACQIWAQWAVALPPLVRAYTHATPPTQQIVLTSETDWGANSTRCTDMVARAAALGQTRVMFVPTLYFVDNEPRNYSAPGQQARVSYFCYTKDASGCPPATVEGRVKFQAGMTACLRSAVARGLSVALAPHIDDGAPGSGAWRQGLVFDPLKPHSVPWGGDAMSYDDFILAPLAAAVANTSTATTKVWFSTQGEMGATLVYHPASHTKLVARLKERVIAGRTPAAFTPTNVKVGVLSNAEQTVFLRHADRQRHLHRRLCAGVGDCGAPVQYDCDSGVVQHG